MRELAALHNAKIDSGTFSAPPPDAHTSLASLPETTLESSTLHSSVTYWIHADYQIETELFLLKHLTLQLESSASDSIQRLTRAVYLDDDDWSVCNSLIPETAGQAVRVSYPQILWVENTMRKEVLIAIPGGQGYSTLPLRRKFLREFLYKTASELDFKSDEWTRGLSPSSDDGVTADVEREQWAQAAAEVRQYIDSSSLHPSTLRLNGINFSHSCFRRANSLRKSYEEYDVTFDKPNLCNNTQKHMLDTT